MTQIPDDDTGAALKRWVDEGSDLTRPMTIDFFVLVPSEKEGRLPAKQDELRDFQISVELDPESAKWTCCCSKTMIPDYTEIVTIERSLDLAATRVGGRV